MTRPSSLTAILVSINTDPKDAIWTCEESIEELKELAYTAGITVVDTVIQSRSAPHPKHYVGKGKVDELKALVAEHSATMLISDDELSPIQYKHLESELQIKVLDRTSLILDIFSQRAQTFEAQLQVELAQLEYLLPRLTRLWTHLSRQAGGIGSRGPGETQLESDKREIRRKVTFLKSKLKKVQQHRMTQRKKREQLPVISVALVGYTNSGKSTIMNRLTQANILAEDKLFATLDPTSRHVTLPGCDHMVLTDTVGFIQKLPTHLVNAFYSTLETVSLSDIVIHVIDASHPNLEGIISTSKDIIRKLVDSNTPILYAFNKWDVVKKSNSVLQQIKDLTPQTTFSALKDTSLESLITLIQEEVLNFKDIITLRVPYSRMDIVNLLHTYGNVLNTDYSDEITINVEINRIIGEKITNLIHKTS
jgi:GTP-binding protein HflX